MNKLKGYVESAEVDIALRRIREALRHLERSAAHAKGGEWDKANAARADAVSVLSFAAEYLAGIG